MKIVKKINVMQNLVKGFKKRGKSVGFVPTMGALHDGHICLIKKARRENDIVVVSIFVNPTQFGPKEDYKKYPRNLKRDAQLCDRAGADMIFAPDAEEMYPPGRCKYTEVKGFLSHTLEGKSRPGHFRGVATIVAKLFDAVRPDLAYFGEKDYQQFLVVTRVVENEGLPVGIVPCPTVREKGGLAMSSRNAYLAPEERKKALVINRALREGVKKARNKKGTQARRIEGIIKEFIKKEAGIKIEYVAVRDAKTLKPVKDTKKVCVILTAVKIGKTRLIDNMKI